MDKLQIKIKSDETGIPKFRMIIHNIEFLWPKAEPNYMYTIHTIRLKNDINYRLIIKTVIQMKILEDKISHQ